MAAPVWVECPNHSGNFDCTPFCSVCEGEQEYQPGRVVSEPVTADWWEGVIYALEYAREELGVSLTDCDLYEQAKEEENNQ